MQKNGRDVAVVISPEEYRRYQETMATPKVRPLVETLLQRSIEKHRALYEAMAK